MKTFKEKEKTTLLRGSLSFEDELASYFSGPSAPKNDGIYWGFKSYE